MGVIALSDEFVWHTGRVMFGRVIEAAKLHAQTDDLFALEQAIVLDGLNLDLKEPEQAERLRRAVVRGAADIIEETRSGGSDPESEMRCSKLLALCRMLEHGPGSG